MDDTMRVDKVERREQLEHVVADVGVGEARVQLAPVDVLDVLDDKTAVQAGGCKGVSEEIHHKKTHGRGRRQATQ
jgi:hypothetical protein